MSAALDELYFDWLYRKVARSRAKTNPRLNHRNLLHILYTKEFVWLIPNDDNRVEDGKDLRYEFLTAQELHVRPEDRHWLELGCSMLEMLIALAKRFAFEAEGTTKERFWQMLENIGLAEINDSVDISREEVEQVLDRVIWRTYNYNGGGGLFPLVHAERDQRKVELWYQLSAYVIENGYI